MPRSPLLHLLTALLLFVPAGLPLGAGEWIARITALTVKGEITTSATIQVWKDGKPLDRMVKVGDAFPVGTMLGAAAGVQVVLKSSNTNVVTLYPETRIRLSAGSDKGEELEIIKGKIFCTVKRALNFFNVRYEKIQASVRGTAYSVEVEPKKQITFAVTEGVVKVEREVKVKIEEGQEEAMLPSSEKLKAGETRVYRLDVEDYLAKYQTYKDAEAYYRKNLEEDRKSGDEDQITSDIWNMGSILIVLTRHQDAVAFFQEYLARIQHQHPDDFHRDVASGYFNLGISYCSIGGIQNLRKGIPYLDKAYEISLRLYPDGNHASVIQCAGVLGKAHQILKNIENIEKFTECLRDNAGPSDDEKVSKIIRDLNSSDDINQVIQINEDILIKCKKLYPNGIHQLIAGCHKNLGFQYCLKDGTANKDKAIFHYNESIRILLQLFPNGKCEAIADAHLGLGKVYFGLHSDGSEKKSIFHVNKSLEIYNQLFPDSTHVGIASCYELIGNIIGVYGENAKQAIGNYEKALEIWVKLKISDKIISDKNKVIGHYWIGLGGEEGIKKAEENTKKAIEHYQESLRIERKLSPDGVNYEIATSSLQLASAYHKLGGTENLRQSIHYYMSTLSIYEKLDPTGTSESIIWCHIYLGNAFTDLGMTDDLGKAIANYEKAIFIYKQGLYRKNEIPVPESLFGLGNSFRKRGDLDSLKKAISHYELSLELYNKLFSQHSYRGNNLHWNIAACHRALGEIYLECRWVQDVPLAVQHLTGALRPSLEYGNTDSAIATDQINLGRAFRLLGDKAAMAKAAEHYTDGLCSARKGLWSANRLALVQGELSRCRLLGGHFLQALTDAREALALDPSQVWIRTYEAHALMLLDREGEAQDLYLKHRNDSLGEGRRFAQAVLEEFIAFRKVGIDHPGFARVEALLRAGAH